MNRASLFSLLLAGALVSLLNIGCRALDPNSIPLAEAVGKFGSPQSHWLVLDVKTTYSVRPYRLLVCRFQGENRWEVKLDNNLYLVEIGDHQLKSSLIETNARPREGEVTFTNVVGKSYARYVDVDKVRDLSPRVQMLVCDDGDVGFLYLLSVNAPSAGQYVSVRMGELLLIREAAVFDDLKDLLSP